MAPERKTVNMKILSDNCGNLPIAADRPKIIQPGNT
jgi:hypothetical protein